MDSISAKSPLDGCVHELFARQAERTPHATAVTWSTGCLTYAELERQSSRLASRLIDCGANHQAPIGLFLDRSVEAIVGMLAILKAGGAYLPLDPTYPVDRLAYMLEDARPGLVLTHSRLLTRFPHCTVPTLCVDSLLESLDPTEEESTAEASISPDHLAYIIYTSGSTGRPKGVLIGHRGLTNLALAQIEEFGIRADDRVLQFASLNFDASVSEVWMTLLAGACLCLTPPDALLAGSALEHLLTEQAISVVTLTPSVLDVLRPIDFPQLRTLIVAGEACPLESAKQWSRGRRFFNAYGPTEVTVCATIARCDTIADRLPIGKPIVRTEAYVLDERMQRVADGDPGELYVAGIGLAWGYLNRPDLSAERFVPNPYGSEPGSRLYKTGDRCRRLPDGNFDFLGRVDHQVKIRGIRIELGEIETLLSGHPGVRKTAVVTRADAQGKNRLVAYVVTESAPVPTPSELRRFLKQSVPDYAVPSRFVLVDSLPLSPSGKVDRNALPAPNWARDEQIAYVAPRTEVERFLAKTFEEVLGISQVGIHDNFFELGGSSIQVVIFAQRLQDRLHDYVYTVALFDAPTVEALAEYLRQHYPKAAAREFGIDRAESSSPESSRPLAFDRLAPFQDSVRRLPPRIVSRGQITRKNPTAVFVLSPPRSGSTLFRVMLAGHPQLFAPPELQLLNFNTLAERKQAFSSERDQFWVNGTIRALMEIRKIDAPTAERFMQECERSGMTVQEFYRLMQDGLGTRLLVDKTPTYPLDPAMLERAESDFHDTRFIHLVRQPGAVVSSFEEAKLHLFFPPFLQSPFQGTPRQLAELVWYRSHRNILAFLKKIPAHRQHRVTFEDMVREPKRSMEGVAAFLGLDFHPDMVDPHKEKKNRMTDPHHPQARMLGDVKFHEHKGIDADAAERFHQRGSEEPLASFTLQFARSLGYNLSGEETAKSDPAAIHRKSTTVPSNTMLPRSGQRSALVAIQPGGTRTPIFCVHPAGGTVLCYRSLSTHLGADQPVYGLQSVGVHGMHHGHNSIEAMASHYLREIRTVQPYGPYTLLGWSLGGVVAYEMAQQSAKQDRPTALVALIDTDLPRIVRKSPSLASRRFLIDFAHQCGLDLPVEVFQSLERKEQLPFLLEKAKIAGLIPADVTLEQFRRLYERNARIFRANVRALRHYVPQPYPQRIVLIRASERIGPAFHEQERTWEDLAGQVDVRVVPGNHYTMIREPLVHHLAAQLRSYLPRYTESGHK